MRPETIALVESTFAQVKPIAPVAAELFYNRLFEIDPAVRALFPTDMKEQGAKLMTMIGAAVAGLRNLEALVPVVESLGKRHVAYGVTDAHYDTVGAALLWTLEKGLGDAFTPEVRDAWTETYTLLATVMKKGAAEA
jgi:hemoglobin-like flavoprotein